jgi:hypothetical protein
VATAVVTVAATAKDATIIMPRTGAVRVRLEAPPGDVVPWNVWCSPGRPSVDASTLTVTRLPVGRRTFDVELRDDAYGKTHLLPVHVDADVRAGETTDLGVVKLDTGVAVSGVVVGPDGKPVVDASVSSGVAGARTAEDGRFTLSPLPRGRVTLEAKQDRLVAQAAVDTTVQGDVTVRLVRARIVLADAAALGRRRDFGVRARPRGATRDAWPLPLPQMDHDARFGGIDAGGVAALPLPPGDWTLEAVSEGDVVLASSDVTVPGDGDGPVRVTLPPK